MQLSVKWWACSAIIFGTMGLTAFAKEDPPKAAIAIMQGIFGDITEVLPHSFELQDFTAKANKAKIERGLKKLADHSGDLNQHGNFRSEGFHFRARQMAKDGKEVYAYYARGNHRKAQFLLHQLTENCAGCHARFPARKNVPAPQAFFSAIKIEDMSHQAQAKVYVMTRQIDKALATYKKIATMKRASALVRIDAIRQYLRHSVRIEKDAASALALLNEVVPTFDKNGPYHSQVATWQKDLKALQGKINPGKDSLSTARSLIQTAGGEMKYPKDKEKVIPFLVASTHLLHYLEGAKESDPNLPEAFYLYGYTESILSSYDWSTEADHFLEMSIRKAPGSPFADKALELLEEQITFGFTGSSGTNIPPDKQALLQDLKKLVKSHTSPKNKKS